MATDHVNNRNSHRKYHIECEAYQRGKYKGSKKSAEGPCKAPDDCNEKCSSQRNNDEQWDEPVHTSTF